MDANKSSRMAQRGAAATEEDPRHRAHGGDTEVTEYGKNFPSLWPLCLLRALCDKKFARRNVSF
jgi:hypothetical protein